ncbi:HTTM domain-containing protein [Halobaculum litoreum]|uniref:HTTM domain-containing protein n=1 Tax=Halobaculum litoreum TaxID=3031998 RepID=UPI0024C2AC99|nr:HTTM domain-containing protein [Halobaculum sp. DT92]
MALRSWVAPVGARLRSAARARLSVDPRALVALRVVLGATLLVDVCLRARFLRFFYTDTGVLPRSVLAERFPTVAHASLYTLTGGDWWVAFLFALTGIAAGCLVAGYRTKAAAVCALVLLTGLHVRNPLVLNGGDSLLRRLLLWSVFLPLGTGMAMGANGTRVETAGSADARDGGQLLHPAAVGLLVQPVVVYVANATVKLRGDAWTDGTAVAMVFSLDSFTVLFGDALAGRPRVLAALGVGWLALLCCAPALVATTGRTRALVVGAFAAAHTGMALTLAVGLFPVVSVAALLPCLPPRVWDAVEPRWNAGVAALARVRGRLRPAALHRAVASKGVIARVEVPGSTVATAARRTGASLRRTAVPTLRRLSRVAAAVLLVGVLVWNATALGYVAVPVDDDAGVTPEGARWDMFAPYPPSEDVRYVAVGTTESGTRVDAIRGGAVRWSRDGAGGTGYPSVRWRKYLEVVRWGDDEALRGHVASALCSRWEATHDGDLDRVALYTVVESTRPGERGSTRVSRVRTHECA